MAEVAKPAPALVPLTIDEAFGLHFKLEDGDGLRDKSLPMPKGKCYPSGMSWFDFMLLTGIVKNNAERYAEIVNLTARVEELQARLDNAGQPPKWKSGVHRSGVTVSHHLGMLFRASADTVAEPGDSPDWERIGTGGFRLCGGFDASRQYMLGDIVMKDYGSFVVDGDGEARLLAGRGSKGEQGPAGRIEITGVRVRGSSVVFDVVDSTGKHAVSGDLEPLVDAIVRAIGESRVR